MRTRSIRGRPVVTGLAPLLVTLALAVALLAAPARAADPGDGQTDEGWKKVLAYARCAINVFRAVSPTDWMVATIDCGRLMLDEPTYPGGGQP